MRFFILWPRRQIVTEEHIIRMYADAVATNQVHPGGFGYAKEPIAMAHALSDAGIITLGSWEA